MLENFLNLIIGLSGHAVFNIPTILPAQNNPLITETIHGICNRSINIRANGKGQDVMNLFHSDSISKVSNPAVKNIHTEIIKNPEVEFALPGAGCGTVQGRIATGWKAMPDLKTNHNNNNFKLQAILFGMGNRQPLRPGQRGSAGITALQRESYNPKYSFAFY